MADDDCDNQADNDAVIYNDVCGYDEIAFERQLLISTADFVGHCVSSARAIHFGPARAKEAEVVNFLLFSMKKAVNAAVKSQAARAFDVQLAILKLTVGTMKPKRNLKRHSKNYVASAFDDDLVLSLVPLLAMMLLELHAVGREGTT